MTSIATPSRPLAHAHIIEFIQVTDWVDFLIEYHRDVPFVGVMPATVPRLLREATSLEP